RLAGQEGDRLNAVVPQRANVIGQSVAGAELLGGGVAALRVEIENDLFDVASGIRSSRFDPALDLVNSPFGDRVVHRLDHTAALRLLGGGRRDEQGEEKQGGQADQGAHGNLPWRRCGWAGDTPWHVRSGTADQGERNKIHANYTKRSNPRAQSA